MATDELDALALEYQRDYGHTVGNLDFLDLINNPTVNGVCRVFRLGSPEQFGDLIRGEVRVSSDNRPYPLLIPPRFLPAFLFRKASSRRWFGGALNPTP